MEAIQHIEEDFNEQDRIAANLFCNYLKISASKNENPNTQLIAEISINEAVVFMETLKKRKQTT